MAMGPLARALARDPYKPQPGRVFGLDTGNAMTTFGGLAASYAWPVWHGPAINDLVPSGVPTVPSALAEYGNYQRNTQAQQQVSLQLQMEDMLREWAGVVHIQQQRVAGYGPLSPLWARAERPHAEPVPVPTHSDNLRWLTRRVDEMRVKLC